jgi:hypothetical protein
MQSDREARIKERAYRIWVEEGRTHGRQDEHWHRAEREIADEEATADKAADTAKTIRRPAASRATAATKPARPRAKSPEAAEKPQATPRPAGTAATSRSPRRRAPTAAT